MLPSRSLLLFCCVYGAMSQFQGCEISSETLAEVMETKARLDVLIEMLKEREGSLPPAPIVPTEKVTTVKVIPTTTTTTKEPTTVRTTTTTQPPTTVTTTTTTQPPPPPPTAEPVRYTDCRQILDAGNTISGFYWVSVPGHSRQISVFCDMDTDGGGWMVFQRRLDGTVTFDRSYAEYARGFGELYDEFWMGNEAISAITQASPTELRVELSDWQENGVYAKYARFMVDGAEKGYRLSVGKYSGTAGDSFGYHDGSLFSAYDVDNDESIKRNCAERHSGGWWFKNCLRSNLNGRYIRGGAHDSFADGVEWARFRGLKYSLMFTEMKMRPVV